MSYRGTGGGDWWDETLSEAKGAVNSVTKLYRLTSLPVHSARWTGVVAKTFPGQRELGTGQEDHKLRWAGGVYELRWAGGVYQLRSNLYYKQWLF